LKNDNDFKALDIKTSDIVTIVIKDNHNKDIAKPLQGTQGGQQTQLMPSMKKPVVIEK